MEKTLNSVFNGNSISECFHFSFEIMGSFSCQALSLEAQTNNRYNFAKVIGDRLLRID